MRLLRSAWGLAAGVVLSGSPVGAQPPCPAGLAHERLNAVLWLQQSAEARASSTQAFRLATQSLDEALRDPSAWPEAVAVVRPAADRKPAIIVDVDETILDNTPEEAAFIAAGRRKFDPSLWDAWQDRANAEPLAGALEFVTYAASRGVAVFYVTNRTREAELRKNLALRRFPLGDQADVVLVPGECSTGDKSSDKECRRQDVARQHRVLLLIGDDLGDFVPVRGLGALQRMEEVDKHANRWGRQWILLANPAYGSWDRVFYDAEKDDCDVILLKKLIGLEGPR
jgi:acid phosphatase